MASKQATTRTLSFTTSSLAPLARQPTRSISISPHNSSQFISRTPKRSPPIHFHKLLFSNRTDKSLFDQDNSPHDPQTKNPHQRKLNDMHFDVGDPEERARLDDEQTFHVNNMEKMFDPRDRDTINMLNLDDLVKQRNADGGPYTYLHKSTQQQHERNKFDPVFDHTQPSSRPVNPAKWSFPPDAKPPDGFTKYDADDGTWWRKDGEASDHEPYFDPEPDQSTIPPPQSRRVDRRKRYYTYMHRNPIDHTFYGPREPSYLSQWLWFITNRFFDTWDTVTRFVIHAIRPIWILSKVMFRIPEFTIKFLLQIKVEIFRYIERRWGPADKRDPDVYKFIPGMLQATFSATRVLSDYIERWGVRDPDVGAALRKYHILDMNTWFADKAFEKLEQLKVNQYNEYLKRKKARLEKQNKTLTQKTMSLSTDDFLRKYQGTPLLSFLTGIGPNDPLSTKSAAEIIQSVQFVIPSDEDYSKLVNFQKDLKKLDLSILTSKDVRFCGTSRDAASKPPLIELVKIGLERIREIPSSSERHFSQIHSPFPLPPGLVLTPDLLPPMIFKLFSVALHHAQGDLQLTSVLHQLHLQTEEIAHLDLQPDLTTLQQASQIDLEVLLVRLSELLSRPSRPTGLKAIIFAAGEAQLEVLREHNAKFLAQFTKYPQFTKDPVQY
jgi:hypothetical protein